MDVAGEPTGSRDPGTSRAARGRGRSRRRAWTQSLLGAHKGLRLERSSFIPGLLTSLFGALLPLPPPGYDFIIHYMINLLFI